MCGIAGFYGLQNDDLIKGMSSDLVHRGPDDEGFYIDDATSLLCRRLERRSSNGELTRREKAWLAQEKRRSKQSHATSILATPSGIISKRRTSGQTYSQGETLRILAEISSSNL